MFVPIPAFAAHDPTPELPVELTWITIAASLAMGAGAVFLFVFAVKKDWFRNLEDAKYQVFWSDPDRKKKVVHLEGKHDGEPEKK